jgi:hypothetical protein
MRMKILAAKAMHDISIMRYDTESGIESLFIENGSMGEVP